MEFIEFNKPHNVVFLDFETTGLNLNKLKVIEVALNTLYKGDEGYQDLINPNMRVSVLTEELTHITNSMLRQQGKPELEVVIQMYNYIKDIEKSLNGGNIYLVAHNGNRFDFPIFRNLLARYGFMIPGNWRFIDTLEMSRKIRVTPRNSMAVLCSHYKVDNVAAHRAMSDVIALSQVYLYLSDDICMAEKYNGCWELSTAKMNKVIKTPEFPEYLLVWM